MLKILGYRYTLSMDGTCDSIGAAGRFLSIPQVIQIAGDLSEEGKLSCALHELIEALKYHLELELDHRSLSALEAGLFQVLCDNGVDLSPLLSNKRKS